MKVLKLDPIVAGVKKELDRYEKQALYLMQNRPALEQLCYLHKEVLTTRRELLTKAAEVESRIRYLETREVVLTELRDEVQVLLRQAKKELILIGEERRAAQLAYRPHG